VEGRGVVVVVAPLACFLSLSLFSLSHQFPLTSSSTPGVAPPSLSPSARVRTTGWRRSGAGVVCRVVGTFVEEE